MESGSFLHTGGVGSPGEACRRRETGKDCLANDPVADLAERLTFAVGWLYRCRREAIMIGESERK
jgi:hypothetical protein